MVPEGHQGGEQVQEDSGEQAYRFSSILSMGYYPGQGPRRGMFCSGRDNFLGHEAVARGVL